MKIVSGLGSIDEYIRLVEAGADEFFCGYVPFEWNSKYGVMSPLNRREVLYYNVQIGTISDMIILSRMVKQYQVPVKIAFNSLFYSPEQYPVIASLIKDCMEIGFDTFIIADIAFILYLRDQKVNCNIHLSGETAEVNRAMIQHFNYFDIKRYIFHRKNTIQDMKSCICNNPVKNVEYEAFVLNEMCHYTGAFCNSLHCDELTHMCKVPYQMATVTGQTPRFDKIRKKLTYEMHEHDLITNDEEQNFVVSKEEQDLLVNEEEQESKYVTGSTGCGLCALMKLKQAGITHLKLVGRGNYADDMEKDIRQLKRALDLLEECKAEEEFQRRVKQELFTTSCSRNCYYFGE